MWGLLHPLERPAKASLFDELEGAVNFSVKCQKNPSECTVERREQNAHGNREPMIPSEGSTFGGYARLGQTQRDEPSAKLKDEGEGRSNQSKRSEGRQAW